MPVNASQNHVPTPAWIDLEHRLWLKTLCKGQNSKPKRRRRFALPAHPKLPQAS